MAVRRRRQVEFVAGAEAALTSPAAERRIEVDAVAASAVGIGLVFLAFGLGALVEAEGDGAAGWIAPFLLVAVGVAVVALAVVWRRDGERA